MVNLGNCTEHALLKSVVFGGILKITVLIIEKFFSFTERNFSKCEDNFVKRKEKRNNETSFPSFNDTIFKLA